MKVLSKNWPSNDTQFITLEEVVTIHERMLEIGGGREGIVDFSLLHSAVERPKAHFSGKPLYKDIYFQAAALIQSLIKNHPFTDGNKRTGYFSTMRFLELNRAELIAGRREIITFTVKIGVKKLNIEDIADWLKTHSRRKK